MSLTPEQQADYDYAMSLIKPKIQFAIDSSVAIKAFQGLKEATQKLKEETDAAIYAMNTIYAMNAIPKEMLRAPYCRCTINMDELKKG